jgi:raffinose/stachyose/melibiose transport system substrate-binding protein
MVPSRITRREFLKLLAASGAVAGSASLLGACRPSAPEKVTLRMSSNHPEWKDPLLEALSFFEKDTGIDIELEPQPGAEYVQLLNAALEAGEGPDLPGIRPGPFLDTFLESGWALDLTGKIKVDNLIDLAQKRVMRKAGVPGAPFGKWTVGIYYHKDAFAQHGLQVPRTWDQFQAVCDTLKGGGLTPIMMPAKGGTFPAFYYLLLTGSVLGVDGFWDVLAGKRKYTDPEVVEAVQFLVDLEPYFPEGFAAIDYANGKAMFARGDMVMALGGSADYAGYTEVNPDVNLDFFAFPPPSASAGVPVTMSGLELVYGVNPASKHTEEGIQFVNWLTLPETNKLFADRIALPTVKGVVPDKPIWARQVEESEYDLPFVGELVEAAPVWGVLTSNMEAVMLHEMSAQQVCQLAQEALVIS